MNNDSRQSEKDLSLSVVRKQCFFEDNKTQVSVEVRTWRISQLRHARTVNLPLDVNSDRFIFGIAILI